MNLWNLFRMAFNSIIKNKMRTFLTMLGIIIGICSVIVMVAIGEGTQKNISERISGLGVNLLTVIPFAFRQGGVSQGGGSGPSLTLNDVDKLKKESSLLSGISPVLRQSAQVIGGTGNWNTTVYGVSPEYPDIRMWTIAEGSDFTDSDIKSRNKICILGSTVATNLFGTASPVGQMVRVKNIPMRIAGVLKTKGTSGMQDQDDLVLIPYTTMQDKLSRNRFIQEILCSSITKEQMNQAQEEIRKILRESHKLKEGADDNFTVMNQSDVIQTANQTAAILTAFLASIAGISLVVGGIGIMNIMLVSVTERTREIGIRMAVGAHENDILTQFLVEAVVLCLAGGIIGIFLGLVIAFFITVFAGIAVVFSLTTILLAFGFSFIVGIFFGFYPAKQAAKLNPIEALRYE